METTQEVPQGSDKKSSLYTPTTLIVPLPSGGKVYPVDSPLHGKTELAVREMTASEEDLLTSVSLIRTGKAIDAVISACLLEKIDPDKLLVGDRNSVLIGLILTSYGNEYEADVTCPNCQEKTKGYKFDLNNLPVKDLGSEPLEIGKNEFEFVLPKSKIRVTFSLATSEDDREIRETVEKLKSATNSNAETNITTRLKKLILSVNGDYAKGKVNELLERKMIPIKDSTALRNYIDSIQPDIDTMQEFVCKHCGQHTAINMPIGFDFFWRTK